MTNMNKIIIKINRNRSMFQNKKMIISIQMKMKNIMKKEISKINQFSKHKVKMLINTIKILKRISQICADENFDPDIVGRVSSASKALCMWVKAIEVYGNIFKQISPQKEKLRLAKETLEKNNY